MTCGTGFSIHDERILGIVRERIPNLVARNILTKKEDDLLEEGIVETIFPGTSLMKDLLDRSEDDIPLKDK